MKLVDALDQISEVRVRMAQTATFRGFRSMTVAFSGVLGIVAAAVQLQAGWTPGEVVEFVDVWVGVAAVSLLVVGAELVYRSSIEASPLKRRLTLVAIQQFLPCLVAGGLVTAALARTYENAWMLPGLWAVLFSLGVFACCRLLPPATAWVGVYYLVSGTGCLILGSRAEAWMPWMMIATFGVGQLLSAGILYWTLERQHEITAA